MQPFRVHCLTCNAPLRVRDASLIGQILPCPKCDSLVEILPPNETQPEETVSDEVANRTMPPVALPPTSGQPDSPGPSTAPPPTSIPELPSTSSSSWAKWIAVVSAALLAVAAALGTIYMVMADKGEHQNEAEIALAEQSDIATRSEGDSEKGTRDNRSDTSVPENDSAEGTEQQPAAGPDDTADEQRDFDQNLESRDVEGEVQPSTEKQPEPSAVGNPTDVDSRQADDNLNKEPAAVGGPKTDETPSDAENPSPAASETPGDETSTEEAPATDQATAAVTSDTAETDPSPNTSEDSQKPAKAILPEADLDVTARLSMKLGDVNFPQIPLRNVITLLADMSAVPIQFDVATLARVGRSPNDPIVVKLQEPSLGEVLNEAIESWGLNYVATGPRVILSVPSYQDGPVRSVRYDVQDLRDSQGTLETLASTIRRVIAPASWDLAGGRGTIETAGGALVVEQTEDIHYQILTLCERLRVARGAKPKSRHDADLFQLNTRTELGETMLAKKVSARPTPDETLASIATRLGRQADVLIAINELALIPAGLSGHDPAELEVDSVSLSEALAKLLTPSGLTHRIVNHRIVEITTPEALEGTYYVDLYPVRELAENDTSAEELIDRIERELDAGGKRRSGGIAYDEPSRCLIVRQTAPVHAALQTTLDRWANENRPQ